MSSPILLSLYHDLGAAAGETGKSLAVASSVMWEAPPRDAARDDTTERSSGIVSNPTADIALDPLRLKVRAAYIEGELAVQRATAELRRAGRQLSDALAAYNGETV